MVTVSGKVLLGDFRGDKDALFIFLSAIKSKTSLNGHNDGP